MSHTLKFIEAMKKYPIIYDCNHKDFRNLRKKFAAWYQLGEDFKTNVENLKKKWGYLRDTYIQHLNGEKNGRWKWADNMKYFRTFFISPGATDPENEANEITDSVNVCSNSNVCKIGNAAKEPLDVTEIVCKPECFDSEDDNPEWATQSTEFIEPGCMPSTPKIRRVETTQQSQRMIHQNFTNPKGHDLDDVDYCMIAYARTISKFSAKRQVQTKLKIAHIIMEQELEQLDQLEQEVHILCRTNLRNVND